MLALGVWVTVDAARTAAAGYEAPRNFTELVALVVGLAALVTALGYLSRAALRAVRAIIRTVGWVESIHLITQRELENGNASTDDDATLKEDVHGIAVALGQLQHRVDEAADKIGHNSERLDAVEQDLSAIYDPRGTRQRKADI